MAQGRSNARLAADLYLSVKTVEHHISSIFAKLGTPQTEDDHRRVLAVVRYLHA